MIARNESSLELRNLLKNNPFRRPTMYENLSNVFGNDWRYWLLPFGPGPDIDGVNWLNMKTVPKVLDAS